jgi:hypothetical protein
VKSKECLVFRQGYPAKAKMLSKSGANYASLANINLLLILAGFATMIEICQVKYLNKISNRQIKEFNFNMKLTIMNL